MCGEVDREAGRGAGAAGVGEQVVEPVGALTRLQPVDHREAGVVAEHRDVRHPCEGRGVELGVEHQVGAVAEDRRHHAVRVGARPGHRRAPRRDDLVAHAGEAVLEVHRRARGRARGDLAGAPAAVQLAGHAARRGQHVVVRSGRVVDDAGHLGVGERPVDHAGPQPVDLGVPRGLLLGSAAGPARRRDPGAERGRELDQHLARVADDLLGAALDRVEARGVDRDHPHALGEAGPRRRREVLQPGADREHEVGLGRDRVGRRRADDAERAGVQRVVVGHQRAAGDGLHDGYAVRLRERDRLGGGTRVAHPAAQHQQRPGGRADRSRGRRQARRVGARPGHAVHAACSKNASGKSHSSACTSCGSASMTGPQSAGSVSTRATCGSEASSCSGRVIRSK